jgi:inorganic pyrophosphatase
MLRVRRLFGTKVQGQLGTLDYRCFFVSQGDEIASFWKDLSLTVKNKYDEERYPLLHFVNEIPKGSTLKMEVCLEEPWHPIKQDEKKGVPRVFKAGPIPFNYGLLPQTWEDPNHVVPDTGFPGDGDPVDVVELSDEPMGIGSIAEIKLLGVLAMIDQGETDWKIIGIKASHPKAALLTCESRSFVFSSCYVFSDSKC